MKKIVNIIFLSSEWDGYHRRELTEELYKKLSDWSGVVLIQLPVSLFVHLFSNFRNKILKLFSGKFKTKSIGKNVYLFTPLILFHYLLWLKFKPFAMIDSFLLKIQINRFIKRQFGKIDYIIVWLYFPQLFHLTKVYKNDFLIYDYYDNFDYDYEGNLLPADSEYNSKLIKKSNLIICTAKKLYERAKSLNENSFYVPNGNSFEKINSADDTILPFKKTKKIVGYIGSYRNWADFSLVESIVKEMPEVDFVFVGSIHPSAENSYHVLKSYKNFHHFRSMPFANAVKFLKLFDVGIIPFRINKFMEGVFPNKFFEYLAAGVPVVTTALPDLEKYSENIGYSKSKEDFIFNINKALAGLFVDKKILYKDLARENSWSFKANQINQLIEITFINNGNKSKRILQQSILRG